MKPVFSKVADKQLRNCIKLDRPVAIKIYELIEDIQENGLLRGKGKPERLKHFDEPTFSRRIDKANRLIYRLCGDEELFIISCKGHYEDT